jgi:hypothetical protein
MIIHTKLNLDAMEQFRAGFAKLGAEGPAIMATLLNEGGIVLRRETVAAETKQIGLPEATVDRAQKALPASAGSLRFTTMVGGGNIRLKYFGAKEGGGGVTAHPWGQSTFYPGAWITSGPKGARAPSKKLNGQVFNASGSKRWWQKFTGPVRSGAYLPDELTKGETVEVFEAGASVILEGIMTKLVAMV